MQEKVIHLIYLAMEKEKLNRYKTRFMGIIALGFLVANCASVSDHKYFNNTLGLNITIGKKIFDSSDAINPQGEGFSIESYNFKLAENRDLFKDKSSYPKTYDVRRNWKISPWQNAPLTNADVQGLLFEYLIEDSDIKAEVEKIKHALNSTNTYLSYYFKESNGEIYAIDICVVDMDNKIVYLCEVVT